MTAKWADYLQVSLRFVFEKIRLQRKTELIQNMTCQVSRVLLEGQVISRLEGILKHTFLPVEHLLKHVTFSTPAGKGIDLLVDPSVPKQELT